MGFYITSTMYDPRQSDVLGINPKAAVEVTSFHVYKCCF